MGITDLFKRREYEITGCAESKAEAMRLAREQLPFPHNPRLYASYKENVEDMYCPYKDRVSEAEAKITYSLTRAGKKQLRQASKKPQLKPQPKLAGCAPSLEARLGIKKRI